MSDTIMGEYDWGLEIQYIDELYRVEKEEIVTTIWKKVQ
jgi:hypothetical protein